MSKKVQETDYIKQSAKWLKTSNISPREKEYHNRVLNILRFLALNGSKNIYQIRLWIDREKIKVRYSSILRYVNKLGKIGFINIESGPRNSRVCTITSYGLLLTFIQHYLSEEEILEAICIHSQMISTLRQIGFNDDKLRFVFKFSVWRYLLGLSPSLTILEQEQLYDDEDSEYEKASDELYGDIISGIEFHIISDAADYIGKQGFSKLSSEDLNELRDKAENALVTWMNLMEDTQKHIEKTRTLLKHLETPI